MKNIKHTNSLRYIFLALFSTLVLSVSAQTTYTSQGSGDFRTITWSPVVPDFDDIAIDDFIIRDGDAVVLASDISINSLQVGQGAAATFTIGDDATSRSLTIASNLTILANATITTASNSATHSVSVNGDIVHAGTTFDFAAGTDVANLTLSNTTTSVISGNGINLNNLDIDGGANVIMTAQLTVNGNFVLDGSGTDISTTENHTISGDFTLSNSATFTATNSTQFFDGGSAQAIDFSGGTATFDNLTFDNSTKNVSGNIISTGIFEITDDAVWSSAAGGDHEIAQFEVKNASGISLIGGTVTFTGGEIRFGDNVNTDGTVTIGDETPITFDGACSIERDDQLTVDGDVTITAAGYLVINGDDQALSNGGADSELNVTGIRTLTIEAGGDLFIRGYDNFPTGFDTYTLDNTSLVRFDQDFDQIIMSENDADATIGFGRLYLSQSNAGTSTKTLFTGDDDLLVNGQFDLVNGINFEVTHSASITIKEDLFADPGDTAGDPEFNAPNSVLTVDANNNQTIDGPVNNGYILDDFIITNTATPTSTRTVNIDEDVYISTGFGVYNPNGSNANLLIVDLDENNIIGESTNADNFTLSNFTAIYSSKPSGTSAEGFAERFDDPSDVINIDANSIIRLDGADQLVPGFNGAIGNLEFSGNGNKYLVSSTLDILGDVERIAGTPVFRFGTTSAAGFEFPLLTTITVAGDWSLGTAYTGSDESYGGTNDPSITFNGTSQTIAASNFVHVTFDNSGTKTLTGNLIVLGDLTIEDGVTLNAVSENIDIAGDWTENGTGTFTQTGGTTDFNGGATQQITATANSYFNDLDITGSTTLNFVSNAQVGRDLLIENGSTFDMDGQEIRIGRDLTINSTASFTYTDPTTSILIFDGTVEQDIRNINAAQLFPSIEFEAVGNKEVVNNAMTIEGDLTIGNESTFNGNNFIINFEGDNWTNNGGFVHNNDVVFMNDGGTTNVSTSSFHDVEVGDGLVTTTVLLAGNISLSGELNINANGTLDVSASNYSITVEEDWNNDGVFVPRNGTVTFTGGQSDYRTDIAGLNTNQQFYNLTINLDQGSYFDVQDDEVLNSTIEILNNLRIESGNFRLLEDASGALSGFPEAYIGGDFIITDGTIAYALDMVDEAKVIMNGGAGTYEINLGGNQVRDFEINADPSAIYQLTNTFEMRDDADNEFLLTEGELDLNGNILTINRGGFDMDGGTLTIDEGASLILNDLAADPDFDMAGGTFRIVGVDGNPATLTAYDDDGFTFTQSGGDFQAQYYTIASTDGDGIRIEGGTIDTGGTGNNFSNGTFTSGQGTAYVTLANIDIGTPSATSVVFNSGPTYNVAVDGGNLPNSGNIEFVIAGGTLAGAQDEFDIPANGATDGYIRWNEDPGLTWIGGTSSEWDNPANWDDASATDADDIPDSDDIIYIPAGSSFDPIIGAGENFAVARVTIRNSGSLTFQGDGQLSVRGNFTVFSGCTLDMTDDASSQLNIAGAYANAGTFNEGSATVTFNGTSGTHSITTQGNGDPFYNLVIDGDGATYTMGSVITVSNAFTLSNGTFDASSGFDMFINLDWTVNGGIFEPGQGRVRFNGASGTQSISGGTMYDVRFEGAAAKSIDGNILAGDDIDFASGSGTVSGNNKTIFVGGNWDLVQAGTFDPGTGTVIFNGESGQSVDDNPATFYNVIFQNSGTKNLLQDVTVNNDFSVIADATTVDFESGTTVSITGDLVQTGGTIRILGSNFPTAATYSLTGGEVEFQANGAQTLPADVTFNDLEIRAVGGGDATTATLTGDIEVNDDLILSTGSVTLDADGNTITLFDVFSLNNNETLTWNGGSLIHTGGAWSMDADFNTSDRTFENLTLNGSGVKTVNSDISVNGNLTIADGVELYQATNSITNDGGDIFTMEANSILDNRVVGIGIPSGFASYDLDPTSTVQLQATGNQTIFTDGGTLTYGFIDLFTNGNATLDGNLIVAGDFDMNGNPTLLDGGFDITLNGEINDIQDYTPTASTTVTFGRSGDQLIQDNDGTGQDLVFENVVFSGSGTKTLTPNAADEVTDISGTVTIASGVIVSTARGVEFSGTSWTNSGTFELTVNTRPFVFDGGDVTMDPGTNDIAALTVSNSTGTTVTIQNNGFDLGTGDFNISADAEIDFGTLTHQIGSENVNIDGAGSWVIDGATLDFDQAGGQTIPIIDEAQANITGIPSIATSNTGTKILTGDIVVDDLTIGSGTNLDVDNTNNYQITVNGSWINNGGDFFQRDGEVVFNSDNTDPKTITSSGELFSAVTFQGSAVRTYSLTDDMAIYGTTAGQALTLASATLDLDGFTLTLGNNDGGDPDAEINIIGSNGTLLVDPGAVLQFDANDDGGDVADTEIGGNLDVQSGGRLSVLGSSSDLAIITRSAGANRVDINIESGGEIEAEYYSMQYLTDEGLEVEDGATIDPDVNGYNFSNGTFSNLDTDAGDGSGGDDNPVSGNRYLTIESDASHTINNVQFNFDGAPTIGEHYNVTRSNAGGNLAIYFSSSSGTLGRNGAEYEDDGDATLPAHSNGLLTWDLPTDTQWEGDVSTDWNNASNWDNGVPDLVNEAIIGQGSPFNPSIDGISVNTVGVTITDGILKVINSATLDVDGNVTLGDGTGGVLIMDNSSTLEVLGSWNTSANALFDNGDGTVEFNAPAATTVTITPGDQSFHNITFTNATSAGEFVLSGANIDINGNVVIENSASLIPSSTNYTISIAGDITSEAGAFDTSVDGEIILDGGAQTITDMDFDELTVSGSGTKMTSGTITVNDVFLIESGVTLQGGAAITFENDVTIRGIFDGVNSVTYTMNGDDWIGGPGSYTGEGTVDFNAAAGVQYIRQATAGSNPVEFHHLTFSGGSRVELGRLVGGTQYDGNVNMTGDLTINNSINTFRANTYLVDNTSGTGTMSLADSEFVRITGTNNFPSNFATYSLDANSTVRYWGTIDQTIRGGISYGNLDLDEQNTKTLGGNIVVAGDLIFREATLDVSTSNYSINVGDRWDTNNGNNDGSFIARSGTVTFDGSADQVLDIGETGTQEFNDVVIDNSGGEVGVFTSDMDIAGNLNVFNGTFDANNFQVTIGGNMTASGTGSYTSGGTGLYYLNASTGAPTIAGNGSLIPGDIEIDATGRTYEMVDDLAILGNFTLTAGTLDVNGQTFSIGDFEDNVNIYGTLNVSTTAKPGGTLALGNDVQLVVNPGGAFNLVGTSSQIATLTSTGVTDYTFTVTGTVGNNGQIGARYYLIEYIGVDGIFINANTTINTTNNFSDGTFQNGIAAGKYLRIENSQDLTDADRIENIVFDDNPGGGASNIVKSTSSTGEIEIYNYSGSFSGESFDQDPNDLITWLEPPTVTWTGTSSSDWFTDANWDSGTVPNNTQDVIIPQTLNEPIITDNAAAAEANNLTLEVNATLIVNTTDAADIDLQVLGDVVFENSARIESTGSEDVIEIGGSWIRESNALFSAGTSSVTFNSTTGAEVIDNSSSFYDLEINVTGTVSLSADLGVDHDFNITAGILNLSSSDVVVGGDFVNSGTITAQTQTISLLPADAVTPKTFDPGTSELYNVIIGDGKNSFVEYDLSDNLIINHDFTLENAELDPNAFNVTLGNSNATVDDIIISGTLNFGPNETLFLGDDAIVDIISGGDFRLLGTGTSDRATMTRRTTGAYDFTVETGATFEADFFLIEHMANNGIWIQAGATLVGLDDGTFTNGSSATQYLRLSNDLGTDLTANDITFNAGPTYNVRRNEAAGSNIIFDDAQGALSGASFELDDGSATTGEVQWTFTNPLTVWTGGSGTNWNDAGNWDNGIPSNANTVQIPDVSPNPFPLINSTSGSADAASLTIFSGASLTIDDDESLTVVNEITNSGDIVIIGSGSISVGDSWTNDGTFDPGTSTVTMTSDEDVTISGGVSFYNLSFDAAGTGAGIVFTTSAAMQVDNNFTVTDGIYTVADAGHTLTVGGNFSVDATNGSFVDDVASVIFNGAAQNIGDGSGSNIGFNNVTVSGSGTKTLLDQLSISGTLQVVSTLSLVDETIDFAGSNLDVDGNLDVSGGTSTFRFSGNQIQVVTGSSGSIGFDNLVVENTASGNSDIQLNIDVTINDNVDFITGVIQSSGSNPLTFNDNATVSFDGTEESPVVFPGTDADGNSYAVGPVLKVGDDDFIFPIGEGNRIARIGISSINASAPTDVFSAQYFFSQNADTDSSPFGGSLAYVSRAEYWDLNRTNGAGEPIVSLFWDTSSDVGDPTTLRVAHFNSGTPEWEDLGRAGFTGDASSGSITANTVMTSFSPVTLGTEDESNPLPVELVDFSATVQNDNVVLNWSTLSESNNDYFAVERSIDGESFVEIGQQAGAGDFEGRLDYEFVDSNPVVGVSYYRLRQVDFNGDFEYSKLQVVSYNPEQTGLEVSIFPNPIENRIAHIALATDDLVNPMNITLIDNSGRMVSKMHFVPESFNEHKQIVIDDQLDYGIYHMIVDQAGNRKQLRLIILD